MRTQLNALEQKLNNKIDLELAQKSMDARMRTIESEINQLIGNLRNMSMLTDSQKLLILKNIDSTMHQLESKYFFLLNHVLDKPKSLNLLD